MDVLTGYATESPLRSTLYALLIIQILRVFFVHRITTLRHVPMPPGASWIWGHEKLVFNASVGHAYASWFETLGSYVIKIKGALFKSDILVISDPLALEHIMRGNTYHYPRSESVRHRIARTLGKSFAWVEGESEHKRMRHLVGPAFSLEVLRNSAQDIYAASEALHASLEARVSADGGSSLLNIQDCVNRATLDVIGRFGFGHDFGGGHNDDGKKIISAWNNMSKLAISPRGFMAIQILSRFPFLNELPLKLLKAQGDVRLTIHKGVGQELLRRQKESDKYSAARKDLLSLLVNAVNAKAITTDEMLDHVSMIIMAGYETTSQTVSYALWELAKHPAMQDRLREECAEFLGEPSYDDMQTKLPFLDAVLRETLRVHPAVPTVERQSAKDDVIPLRHPIVAKDGSLITELHIEPGQTVVMPIHAINRQNSVWGDGNVFRPQRWVEPLPPQDMLTKGWGNTLAFSDGPRNCIGFKLALFESKALLFVLVKSFRFHDTGAVVVNKLASSLQAVVVGEEEKGPQLPIRVTFVE